MLNRLAADLTLVLHFGFIVFVVVGAVGALRWPKLAWLHVPAAAWGVWIEISGGICPLTTLENRFRLRAGGEGYAHELCRVTTSCRLFTPAASLQPCSWCSPPPSSSLT